MNKLVVLLLSILMCAGIGIGVVTLLKIFDRATSACGLTSSEREMIPFCIIAWIVAIASSVILRINKKKNKAADKVQK